MIHSNRRFVRGERVRYACLSLLVFLLLASCSATDSALPTPLPVPSPLALEPQASGPTTQPGAATVDGADPESAAAGESTGVGALPDAAQGLGLTHAPAAQPPATQPADPSENSANEFVPEYTGNAADGEDAEASKPEVASYLWSKFQDARAHYQSGRYQAAHRIADSIMVLEPRVPFRDDVLRLRRKAEARHLGLSIVEIRFEPTPLEEGEIAPFPLTEVKGRIVIENVTEARLHVGRGRAEQAIGQARCRITEYYADGTAWSREETQNIKVPRDFVLPPGDSREFDVVFNAPRGVASPVLQRISVKGVLRPRDLRLGGRESISRTIPWQEYVHISLPEALRVVRQEPFKQIRMGLLGRDGSRLVAATHVFLEYRKQDEPWREGIDDVVDEFLAALEPKQRALHPLIFRLLEVVTGAHCEPTVQSWKLWAIRKKAKSAP